MSDLFVRERGPGRASLSQNKSNSYFNLVFFLFPPLNQSFNYLFACRGCQKSSFWKLDTERTNYVFHIFPDVGLFLYSATLYTVSWYSVTVSWYSDEHQAAKPEFHDFENRFKSLGNYARSGVSTRAFDFLVQI